MRKRAAITVAAIVVLAACTRPGAAPSTGTEPTETLRAVSIADGDTFTAVPLTASGSESGSWASTPPKPPATANPPNAEPIRLPKRCGA